MRSILEKAIVHLLNEDNTNAEKLFHKFILERARQIHESLRQGDETVLSEGWDDEMVSEEYMTDDDLANDDSGDDVDDATGVLQDDMETGDGDVEADLEHHEDNDADTFEHIDDRFDDLEDHIAELTKQFQEMMDQIDGDEDAEGSEDVDGDMGDVDVTDTDMDQDGDVSEVETDLDTDNGDVDVDVTDEDEEKDDLDGITEAAIAALEKVVINAHKDGVGVGTGKTDAPNQNRKSALPDKHGDAKDAKPAKSPFTKNDDFDLQKAPATKVMKGLKNAGTEKEFVNKVAPKGDAKATLNKDFAPGGKPSKSPIDGK